MKNLLLSLAIVSVVILSACEGDDGGTVDVTPPTITLEEPGFGEQFAAGGDIHFEALFEDDVALATYELDIHDVFDGHSHGRTDVTIFTYQQSFDLTGTSDDVHEDIEISSDATAGPYHFTVEAIDAAGNSTTFADGSSVESEIWITNEEMVHVHFEDDGGTEVDEYDVELDVNIAGEFYGEIEDEVGTMHEVVITVGHLEGGGEDHDHEHERVMDDEIYEGEFEEVDGETSVNIEDLLDGESIIVSQADLDELEEDEHLYLIVTAWDEAGNISRHSIELHFD